MGRQCYGDVITFTSMLPFWHENNVFVSDLSDCHADSAYGNSSKSMESLSIGLKKLTAATKNFCDACKLGEGGFGSVYKVFLFWKHLNMLP